MFRSDQARTRVYTCSFDRATTKTEVRIAGVYSKHRKATAPLVCPVVKSMLRLTLASGGTPLLGKKYGHVSGSPLFCDYLDIFCGHQPIYTQ